jgi:hypothetical protein
VPALNDAYKHYIKSAQSLIENSTCLNESRSITASARKVLQDGYRYDKASNKNVGSLLDGLESMDHKIIKKSKNLNELLDANRQEFIRQSKKLLLENNACMEELSNGSTPAVELLERIAKLGKEFVSIINIAIPAQTKSVKEFVKKSENEICYEVESLASKISKLDNLVLSSRRTVDWYEYSSGFFERKAAFEFTNYEV